MLAKKTDYIGRQNMPTMEDTKTWDNKWLEFSGREASLKQNLKVQNNSNLHAGQRINPTGILQ